MQIHPCPVCQTPYRDGENSFCGTCGWEVRSYPWSELPPEVVRREERTLGLVKTRWEEFKKQEQELKELREKIQYLSTKNENPTDVGSKETAITSNERLLSLAYVVRSETNKREKNEDSFQVLQIVPGYSRSPITVLAVADGMGGHAYGEDVSREALRKVSMALFEQLSVQSSLNHSQPSPIDAQRLSAALMSAVEQANAYVRRLVEANKWGKAGSTIVIAAILEDSAVVAFLGDSPMFHFQVEEGKLTKVTEDHTVAGVLQRAGMITPEMARYHEGRSRLEFYLGGASLPRENPVRFVDLKPQDLLLLCSDGVSGSLTETQITKILSECGTNLKQAGESLIQTAVEAGETDNQTLILWRHLGESVSNPEVIGELSAEVKPPMEDDESWPFELPPEGRNQELFKTVGQNFPPPSSQSQTSENLEEKK